jgi:hypothetical protein
VPEQAWLACDDPVAMLADVAGTASPRKLRLFVCAGLRRYMTSTSQAQWECVELAERWADGLVSDEEVAAQRRRGRNPRPLLMRDVGKASWIVARGGGMPDLQKALTILLRDLLGDPHRPLSPRFFPAHVVGLAQACYAAFPEVSDQFLILADALDDLGEGEVAVHCRETSHARGCHVLDWILGKG